MGLTQKLGTIPLAIFTDASNNIGIGGSPSGNYKFEVTGTGRFTGALTGTSAVFAGSVKSDGVSSEGKFIIERDSVATNTIIGSLDFTNNNAATTYGKVFGGRNSAGDGYVALGSGVSNNLYALETGFVGINTSTPASRLFVSTTAGATKAYDDLSKTNIMVFDNTSMAAGVGGSITFGGYKTAQTAGGNFAAIDGVKENGTAGNEAGAFRIWTANSTGVFGERMRITSGGNVGIGVPSFASTNERLVVRAASTTSSDFALVVQNSSGFDLLNVRADGLFNTGTRSLSPYNFDPGGRVMYVNSLGQMGSTSSTRESKIHINPITSVDYIMQLNPVSFYHRIQDTETRTYTDEYFDEIKYGFIADEVEKVNLDLVFYNENEDGTKKLAGVEYMSMIAVLTKAVQELSAKVSALENKS
jgi:hypothetical protein